jgi:orotidine-5'-phosphate decarboxylase
MLPQDRLIFALDVPNNQEALKLVELLHPHVGMFKVGLQLFIAEGIKFFQTLAQQSGAAFFLDLKLHDIPATIQGAQQNIFQGVKLTTVHCDQGPKLLQAMVEAINKDVRDVKVLGVTVLTSVGTEDLLRIGIDKKYADPPSELVKLRARLAREAGCHGVVCAGTEAAAVKSIFGKDFLVVCPGIRPEWSLVPGDDQARVMTPARAIRAGADYLVVGRPIRLAADPAEAARKVVGEIELAVSKL